MMWSASLRLRRSDWLWQLCLLAGWLGLLWLRFHQPPNTVDDAYITFRYARNLAQGLGLIYNPGEAVLGTTTSAYAMWLALLSRLTGYFDYPHLALMTNAWFDVLTFAVLVRLGNRLIRQRWLALAAAGLFAIDGRVLDWSTGGMETSLNVLVIVATLTLFLENRRLWAAGLAGLALLIRPDGATLAAALFLGWGLPVLWKPRQWPWREAAVFLAITIPWFAFATLVYGTPIPQSVLAKSIVYRLPPGVGLRAFLVQLRTIFPFSLPPVQDGQSLAVQFLQAAVPAGLCGLGAWGARRHQPRLWALGIYIALFIAFFSVGNPLWLGWYETPLMPLYQLLILAAAGWLAGHLNWAGGRSLVLAAAVGLLAVPQLSRLNVIPWEKPQRDPWVLNATFNKKREADYRLMAEMLAPAARAQRVVAIPEIGAFGYYYPGTLFDTTGLVSPGIRAYFPIPADIPIDIYSVPRQMLLDLRFDWFVSFDNFIQATIPLDDPEFLALYRPTVGLTSHAAFGIQRLLAYRRVDQPVEVALPSAALPLDVWFGPAEVHLAGYRILATADADHHYLDAQLFWQGRQGPIDRDLLIRAQLVDAQGQIVYEILRQPGDGLFPSQSWTPGFWLVDRYPLIRPAGQSGPYTIQITVFASDADAPLPAAAAAGVRLSDSTVILPVVNPEESP